MIVLILDFERSMSVRTSMIYLWLLPIHSSLRWLVLLVGALAIGRAWLGLRRREWTRTDRLLGVTFISLLDTQLLIGSALYAVSPLRIAAYAAPAAALDNEMGFFAFLHPGLMVAGVIVAHVGKALAKRTEAPARKQAYIVNYFAASLLLMALAIPWWRPFVRF